MASPTSPTTAEVTMPTDEYIEGESEFDESRMPLTEHLGELRGCLVRSLIAFFIGFLLCYNYAEQLILFLERPLLDILPPDNQKLYYTGITDKFFTYLKVCALSAVGATCPYILFEVWRFMSPALYQHEKKFAIPFIILGTFAFFAGMSFAYYIVIPYGYKFLIEFGASSDQAIITLTEYFGLTIKMLLGLGLVFELPVVLILLGKLGIIEAQLLTHYRRHAIVGVAVLAAIITPSPDAFTMLLVTAPLWLLYEISIIGVKMVQPKKK